MLIANPQVRAIVDLALVEDVGTGDLSGRGVVPDDAPSTGTFLLKSDGVISGLEVVALVCATVDPAIHFAPAVADGDQLPDRTVLGSIEGPARSVLIAERTSLNFLQQLSGVATMTRRYVDAVAGTNARIVDTRKTSPGMRVLEKAAVRHGGGQNHRIGLFDGVMIKDNHIVAFGGDAEIGRAVAEARARIPHTVKIEIEVANLDQLRLAVGAGAEIIMLDNMDVETMREAVAITGRRAILEASGGITLETVRAVAETGVDLISVGALTHSAPALDISLNLSFPGSGPWSPQ